MGAMSSSTRVIDPRAQVPHDFPVASMLVAGDGAKVAEREKREARKVKGRRKGRRAKENGGERAEEAKIHRRVEGRKIQTRTSIWTSVTEAWMTLMATNYWATLLHRARQKRSVLHLPPAAPGIAGEKRARNPKQRGPKGKQSDRSFSTTATHLHHHDHLVSGESYPLFCAMLHFAKMDARFCR